MIISISDKEKGSINYNLNDGCCFTDFKQACAKKSANFIHIANVKENAHKASGYYYEIKAEKSKWKKTKGWAYALVVNDRILKLGMTEVTLSSRFSSYQAGTKNNREKGTCSVTNYYCSEAIRECLSKNCIVSIHAYEVPTTTSVIKVLGKETTVHNKTAYVYEHAFLREHQEIHGKIPPLCNNTSLL